MHLVFSDMSRIGMTLWSCPVCGIKANVSSTTPRIFCCCGYRQLNGVTPGLGDRVAAILHRVGITPERYAAMKAAVGLKRKCDCDKRQEALNSLGRLLS